MKEGEGKEEGAEIGCREGCVNQSEKTPMCQRNEGEGNSQKKGGSCINVDTRKNTS